MKRIKLYKVIFNHYVDYDHLRISTAYYDEYNRYVGEDGDSIGNVTYINIPPEFIISENEIDKYSKFGCGFKELIYVGDMLIGFEGTDKECYEFVENVR